MYQQLVMLHVQRQVLFNGQVDFRQQVGVLEQAESISGTCLAQSTLLQ
jgi:hypothetical protein